MSKETTVFRGYIYLAICSASLLYRAYLKDTEGMILTILVIPLCLLMILRDK